jgi:hypothetical protein
MEHRAPDRPQSGVAPAVASHLEATRTPELVHQAVAADVARAARLIDAGLSVAGFATQRSAAHGAARAEV